MRSMMLAVGVAMMVATTACGGSDGSSSGTEDNLTASIPTSAIGSYYLSSPTVGATLTIYSVSPFRFNYSVSGRVGGDSNGYISDALASVSDGRASYAPADDCSVVIRPRNDGVEVRQTGSCASESFKGALDGTGVYLPLPNKVGDCATTTIASISGRFDDDTTFESGVAISFDDQLNQISYDRPNEVARSVVGDPVQICLVELPSDCPVGDDRGKVYKTTNTRTGESWTMSDSTHSCGGA